MQELTLDALSDESAERALLAACLRWADAYFEATDLAVEDFALDSHRRLWRVIGTMHADGIVPDLVTISERLASLGMLSAIGGVTYLAHLDQDIQPLAGQAKHYAAAIRSAARRRALYQIAERTMAASCDVAESPEAITSRWEDDMLRLVADRKDDDSHVAAHTVSLLDHIERQRKAGPGLSGLTYGLDQLDAITSGMHPGEVTVVGARSSVGKTSLMIQAAVANARQGIGVHFFSIEMTREAVLRRIYSLLSGVYFFRLRDPRQMSDHDAHRVRQAAQHVAEWPLWISDSADMPVSQMCSEARLSIRRHGVKLVCVDYAQIVAVEGRDDPRTKVSAVSRALTSLAKREGCSLMLASQLRKMRQEDYDKAPHIADLRETGQLENDAHVVVLAHRGWDHELGRIASHGQLIIPKQRSGETGTMPVTFDRNFLIFTGGE